MSNKEWGHGWKYYELVQEDRDRIAVPDMVPRWLDRLDTLAVDTASAIRNLVRTYWN